MLWNTRLRWLEWIAGEGEALDNSAVNEVFLDDFLEDLWPAGVVPNTFGIYQGDGSMGADAQAIDFAAINQGLRPDEIQFLEAAFEKFPRFEGDFAWRALGLGLVGAKKNMAAEPGEAEGVGHGLQFFRDFHCVESP